jgi:protein-tyrosine phosphatase
MSFEVAVPKREDLPAYNRVVGGLFVGSALAPLHHWRKFDILVSTAEEVVPRSLPGRTVMHMPMADDFHWNYRQDDEQVQQLLDMASRLADAVRSGKKVLVYCNYGLDRSALLTALVLLYLGYPADQTIEALRGRHEAVLMNPAFEKFVRYAEQNFFG